MSSHVVCAPFYKYVADMTAAVFDLLAVAHGQELVEKRGVFLWNIVIRGSESSLYTLNLKRRCGEANPLL